MDLRTWAGCALSLCLAACSDSNPGSPQEADDLDSGRPRSLPGEREEPSGVHPKADDDANDDGSGDDATSDDTALNDDDTALNDDDTALNDDDTGDDATPNEDDTGDDTASPADDDLSSDDGVDDDAPPRTDARPAPSDGRYGVPESTFELPGDQRELYYPDLPASFPDVDFTTLDRLYLPAGRYRSVLLGGLPVRDADRPLVITNRGGQVEVGGDAANYVFVIQGGSNWVLTGRYDALSQTGHEDFVGHATGQYAYTQGSYGIFIDDRFSKAGLSGLSIGGGASDFEIEMLEVTRAEFAGIVAKTDDDGSATMRNVRLHDTYVHDVGSEGIYFGSTQAQPQHAFEGLLVYENRFLRTGTEALQVGQLGEGCEIHHNVLGPGAIRWRSAFQRYQDGNVQFGQRYGSSSFHHNVVVGTGDLFVEFFPQPVEGDGHGADDTVVFHDNYFSDTSSSGVYTHAEANDVRIVFENNSFRGFRFDYDEVYPDAMPPNQVFGIGSNTENPHLLSGNRFDADIPFVEWTFDSTTLVDNEQASVARLQFVDFMNETIDANVRRVESWTDRATLSPDEPVVRYAEGDYVMHLGVLYRARVENSEAPPDQNPEVWQAEPAPADDVRVRVGSPYAGYGIGG